MREPTAPLTSDHTEVDATAGTQVAAPHAIARTPIGSTGAPPVRPSATGTPRPTAADALDRGELSRLRVFHVFGVAMPLAALAVSLLIGGDPFAQRAFWTGAIVMALCNVGLVWLTGKPERYQAGPVGVLWMVATLAIQAAVYYFGPYSAVVMVDMLGIVFVALGRTRWTALATAAICIGGHIAITLPIIAGWMSDVGVLPSVLATRSQLMIAEGLVIAFLASGYALGRWARSTSARALAELESAMRIIGDREQALAEVVDAEKRQQRVNEGRWTGQQMGSFKLGIVLGRGAMGEVYEANDTAGQLVAVKLLNARSTGSSALLERFRREMDVAARLESPHIVRVLELSSADAPVAYIAMERLYGTDLATRLRSETRLPTDELVVLVDQVARGLEVARLAGVVHRDLKPHNLFLHDGATWKILDFGVAKVMDSEGTLTGEGIVGTPQYMAPEQASGGHVTHLADVYALGAIAYRCLTGRSPFKGKDLPELVYQLVHTPPVRPSLLARVPSPIEDVIAVAMAKDPRRRFPSAMSFAHALISVRRGRAAALDVPNNAWT